MGYHFGKGDKEPCDNVLILKPVDWHPHTWLKGAGTVSEAKKEKTQAKNQKLLEIPLKQLIDEGELPLIQLKNYSQCKDAYKQLQHHEEFLKRPKLKDGDIIPATQLKNLPMEGIEFRTDQKCRHYWLWSEKPDKGKSTFLKFVCETYRAQICNSY